MKAETEHDALLPAPDVAPLPDSAQPAAAAEPNIASQWFRRLIASNPFYPISAALLLYGLYRVSGDPVFAGRELAQLGFKFGALQVYELLLVATAILLAIRRIWYDSMLLVWLENLLVFVPFILVTQAVLIDRQYVWLSCIIGGGAALVRFGGVRRFIPQLNLPVRLLGFGTILLALNISLPILYRALLESNRFGPHPTEGSQYEWARFAWILILPAAYALGNFLPHSKEDAELLPQRRWLPDLLFLLWILASTVHVYCLDYVYGFDVRPAWVVPGLWVLLWTGYRRHRDVLDRSNLPLERVLAVAPMLTPWLAFHGDDNWIFPMLAALNIVAYTNLWIRHRTDSFTRHLPPLAVALFIAGWPVSWLQGFVPGLGHGSCAALAILGYVLFWTIVLRSPRLALLCAGTLFLVVFGEGPHRVGAIHWAGQIALGFLVLHSLFWDDTAEKGVRLGRIIVLVTWVIQTFVWAHASHVIWSTLIPGAIVLGACVLLRWIQGQWRHPAVLITAALTALAGPLQPIGSQAANIPAAMLVVLASFICFGIGTLAALTKHRWHQQSLQARQVDGVTHSAE